MKIDQILAEMWTDYINLNPMAKKVYELFQSEEGAIQNDHIALRTFNLPKVNLSVLAKVFIESGYVQKGEYHFEEKKLYAQHFEKEGYPKIFISELLVEKFAPPVQAIIKKIVDQIPLNLPAQSNFTYIGRPWQLSLSEYEQLAAVSEYASWLGAIGYRPNHFTVFVNPLKKLNSISKINEFLKSHQIPLNTSGGEIKGSAEVLLEQSSTLASTIEVQFSDGKKVIPSCYYEFAKRYPLPDGTLYQGFVAASADKTLKAPIEPNQRKGIIPITMGYHWPDP